jgi:hypothetical protein
MRRRGAPTWTHHVLAESAENGAELAFGETRHGGDVVATWVAPPGLDSGRRAIRALILAVGSDILK